MNKCPTEDTDFVEKDSELLFDGIRAYQSSTYWRFSVILGQRM